MKTLLGLSLLASLVLSTSGCYVYETRHHARTVVVAQAPYQQETIVTVLPRGYHRRHYRGTTYYYSGNQYYRSYHNGYVVTTRPW